MTEVILDYAEECTSNGGINFKLHTNLAYNFLLWLIFIDFFVRMEKVTSIPHMVKKSYIKISNIQHYVKIYIRPTYIT